MITMKLALILFGINLLIAYLLKDVEPTHEQKVMQNVDRMLAENWNDFVDHYNKTHRGKKRKEENMQYEC